MTYNILSDALVRIFKLQLLVMIPATLPCAK